MSDFPAGPITRVPRAETVQPQVQRAARQLEGAFATELMKAARPRGRDGMFTGGIGAHTFDSFMDEALGAAMTRNGELGLASHIARALARAQAASAGGAAGAPASQPSTSQSPPGRRVGD